MTARAQAVGKLYFDVFRVRMETDLIRCANCCTVTERTSECLVHDGWDFCPECSKVLREVLHREGDFAEVDEQARKAAAWPPS